VGVGEGEFVEVVDVRDAKIERRGEDDRLGRRVAEEVERDDAAAEEELFGDGAGDEVAVAHPRAQGWEQVGRVDALDQDFLEEGAQEKNRRQQDGGGEG